MTHLTALVRACVALFAWSLPFCAEAMPAQVVPAPAAAARSAEGDRLLEAGDLDGAVREYSAALAADDRLRPALLGRAQAYEWLGRPRDAVRDLDRLLRHEPDDVDARAMRGRLHIELGRHAAAEADLARAVSLRGDDAELLTWYGYALLTLDRNDRALEVLQRAHTIDPQSDAALDMLAWVELELGHLQDALRHADAAVRIEPAHGAYHYTRSRILRALGRHVEADEAAATAGELDPSYVGLDQVDLEPAAESLLALLAAVVALLAVMSLIGLLLAPGARAALRSVPEGELPARYDGRAAELFRIYLQNVVLTVVTLGVYRFWAKVRVRRYRYQHTAFADGRFDYHATGREKFIGFLKGMVLLLPLVGGAYALYRALAPDLGEDLASTVAFWSFLLVMFLLRPLILVASQRYNLSRTSWNNLRLRFTGRVGRAYGIYAFDLVLIIGTLGVYFPWHLVRVREFRMRHTMLGDRRFGFRFTGDELFRILFGGTLLCYLTLGFYVPWHIARLHRFHTENTTFHGHRLRSRLTGRQVMAMGAPAVLLSVLTLGLAIPWLLDRWYRLITDTTSYEGTIDVDELRSIQDAQASALIEGLGESGDALSEVGDLFGT